MKLMPNKPPLLKEIDLVKYTPSNGWSMRSSTNNPRLILVIDTF